MFPKAGADSKMGTEKAPHSIDERLKGQLEKLDEHINNLFRVEHEFLTLDGNKKALLAVLTIKALGKSFSEREALALASPDWKDFVNGHAMKEAEYNRAKRRYELLIKAYDGTYLTYKIEENVIRRQR